MQKSQATSPILRLIKRNHPKLQFLKKTIYLLIGMTLSQTNAAVIFYESLDGSNFISGNTLIGVTGNSADAVGSSGAWGLATAGTESSWLIKNASPLSYSNGTISISGGSKYLNLTGNNTTNNATVSLASSIASTSTVYFSSLIRTPSTVSGSAFLSLFNSPTDSTVRARVGESSSNFAAGMNATSNNTISSLSTGTTHLIVGKLNSNGTSFTSLDLFLDPNNSSLEGTPTASIDPADTTFTATNFGIRTFSLSSGNSVDFDEFRIATTWADVTRPIPEPSSIFFITITLLALITYSRHSKAYFHNKSLSLDFPVKH